jgi:uncharacterized protein
VNQPVDPVEPVDVPAGPRDARLVVPIFELVRRIGTRRPFHVDTFLQAPLVAGVAVPIDEPVTGDLIVESVLDGIVVEGTLTAPWAGECRRCLDPIRGRVDIAVREVFEKHATPGDTYPIEGDHIDLHQLVHDNVLLALPLSPLCRPDCAGPDPERFPAVVEHDEPAPPAGDPRWSALTELRFDE